MNNQLSKKAILFSRENKKLIFIFITVQVLLNLVTLLPFLRSDTPSNPSSTMSTISMSMFISVAAFFIVPFIDAGLFGLAFLKLKNKKIEVSNFLHIAKCNFWGFLRVSIVVSLIYGLFWIIVPRVLPYIFSNNSVQQSIISYSLTILSCIITLFFVLALPLVIVGYFSGQNLHPIKSSITKFFNHITMFKFVITLVLVQYIIGLLPKLLIPQDYFYYSKIVLPFLTTPMRFIVLIYAYLLITNYFMKDIQFDFEK